MKTLTRSRLRVSSDFKQRVNLCFRTYTNRPLGTTTYCFSVFVFPLKSSCCIRFKLNTVTRQTYRGRTPKSKMKSSSLRPTTILCRPTPPGLTSTLKDLILETHTPHRTLRMTGVSRRPPFLFKTYGYETSLRFLIVDKSKPLCPTETHTPKSCRLSSCNISSLSYKSVS